ncbi:MAG: esterase-like activity of phytase family protein [Flavisolibacter sp.]
MTRIPFPIFYGVSFIFILMLGACSTTAPLKKTSQPKLKLLHHYTLPFEMVFDQTPVGGLSGIDYDFENDLYYLICDDRSDLKPARFYTARIVVKENRIDTIIFLSKKNLLKPDGHPYPSAAKDPRYGTDPESIRFLPGQSELYWSSEGERLISEKGLAFIDPYIYTMDLEGRFKDSFLMPSNFRMQSITKGPRRNGVLESICFDDRYKTLYAGMEEPLFEDGPGAATGDTSAWIRMIVFNVKSKKPLAQYGYRIDPVKWPPVPAGAYKVNGVSEMLYIKNKRLIVMERSFSVGIAKSGIRLYLADLSNADDVSLVEGLHQRSFLPVTKSLLYDLDTLGIYVDNMEGMCWGPVLANGKKSLILVSDNNFSKNQKTQFFLFEYNGE